MSDLKKKYSGVMETIEWPVKYDEETFIIRDKEQRPLFSVKLSRGLSTKLDAPLDLQEQIGELIVELLNEVANE